MANDNFKRVIRTYLDKLAENDTLFAANYIKENKNIDDCVIFIMNKVKEMIKDKNEAVLPDEDVYNLAVHYYTEDDIIVTGLKSSCNVVSPYVAELNQQDLERIKQEAIEKAVEQERKRISTKYKKTETKTVEQQQSLF